MKQKIENIEDLRNSLLNSYENLLNGTMDRKLVKDLSLISCRIMGTLSLELREKDRMKDAKPLKFLSSN